MNVIANLIGQLIGYILLLPFRLVKYIFVLLLGCIATAFVGGKHVAQEIKAKAKDIKVKSATADEDDYVIEFKEQERPKLYAVTIYRGEHFLELKNLYTKEEIDAETPVWGLDRGVTKIGVRLVK